MLINLKVKKTIFIAVLLFCLTPVIDAQLALILGIIVVNSVGNPFQSQTNESIKWLLKFAIVGLGFGMNFYSAVNTGKQGFLFTFIIILLVFCLGWFLSKILKIDSKTSLLVSAGTAICGGSAIAAVAPILEVDAKKISVALGTVFVLNAVALLIFPIIGFYFELTQYQFGLWSATAIHDTSSVVGAASKYGSEALEVATTIKLGRALWIIPLSILVAIFNKKTNSKINIPYFIGFFIVAMLINTFLPEFKEYYSSIVLLSKKALVVTLFLIGTSLSLETIKSVGFKTFIQGVVLWLTISILSLIAIIYLY